MIVMGSMKRPSSSAWRLLKSRGVGLAAVLLAMGLLGCGAAPRRSRATEVARILRYAQHRIEVGPYLLRGPYVRNATLAGAQAALGGGDTCAIQGGDAKASWRRLGVYGLFTTLGGFSLPNGKPDYHGNGCKYRAQVQPDSMTATSSAWHTDRGLHVGDDVGKMYRLYPNATFHTGFGSEPSGWWLQTAQIIPGVPPLGALIAYVKDGTISGLRVRIAAEGE
jgi:hypothetical protein